MEIATLMPTIMDDNKIKKRTASESSVSNQKSLSPIVKDRSGSTDYTPSKADLKVLADGKVMKVQKTRQRKILSCVYCHSKKIKCSRVQPVCNNCEKLGMECKYFMNERKSRGGKQSSRLTEEEKISRAINYTFDKKSESVSSDDFLENVELNTNSITLASAQDTKPSLDSSEMNPSDHGSSHSHHGSMDHSHHGSIANSHSQNSVNGSEHQGSVASHHPLVDDDPKSNSPMVVPELSLNYLNMNLHNSNHSFNPHSVIGSPQLQNHSQVLQAPILNNLSNNITNVYFNSNYGKLTPNKNASTPGNNLLMNDDTYSFNLSSFTFAQDTLLHNSNYNLASTLIANSPTNLQKLPNPLTETPSSQNFFDKNGNNLMDTNSHISLSTPTESPFSPSSIQANTKQPNNPGLHNSLNAYPSNPATIVDYLYGTNNYYENDNLLDDLLKHLPSSRARSFELIDRYINSVHILLPIVVNFQDFLKEHEHYWNISEAKEMKSTILEGSELQQSENSETTKSSSSSSPPSTCKSDFNYLQFYTLYFPILYASTISEFEEYDNLLLNQDIDKYLKAFNKICQYYNYPHGIKTIPLLLGNVIIQSTSPNPSTMEMSQIIRYAKFLQMHKDPVITLRINDWEVIKFRRLLWWVIFGLDALTSHNFCLPPVCKFDDFNVLMPEEEEPVFNKMGHIKEKQLNVSILSMNVKFKYDRIMSELVYHLHNGLASNITSTQINEIKEMIIQLFKYIHTSISRMNHHFKTNPPNTVQEMNLINFIKNHSWSFVDRALMLLHKKILLGENKKVDIYKTGSTENLQMAENSSDLPSQVSKSYLSKNRGGLLSLSQYEDTFGHVLETNIIDNLNNSSISLLKFNQFENFSYGNMNNNLIPSILHNLNDFLKYNDFIKFGKFNWYIKRTIPLDSIILMFVIITVKFKYEFMTMNELCIYVKLINKALFILNRKWFKNEKYKRMLSLTNLTWEFILKRYNITQLINQFNDSNKLSDKSGGRIEFFDYQVTGYMNMNDLFIFMDVPQPVVEGDDNDDKTMNKNKDQSKKSQPTDISKNPDTNLDFFSNSLVHSSLEIVNNNQLAISSNNLSMDTKAELMQLNEKIYYDLRNNFVDINDYCAFYTSLENILHELMDYIHKIT